MTKENATELTVTIKNVESTYRQKFLLYDPYSMLPDDPVVLQCIDDATKMFKGVPENIQVRSLMVVQ